MNIYLEDIADEFSYHQRSSSQGLLRSRHHQGMSDHRLRHSTEGRTYSDKKNFRVEADRARASRKRLKSDNISISSTMQSNQPVSSWVSDPEEQWEWLHRVMDEARRKDQNVSQI